MIIDKANLSAPIDVSNTKLVFFDDAHVNLGIATQVQKLNAEQIDSLIELYIAFFNRVPDSDGLYYWIDQLISGQTIDQIAESFYLAGIAMAEYTGYSKDMDNADFIKRIYRNVLGRRESSAPNQAEINYWVDDIRSGRQTRGSVLRAMLDSAHSFKNNPQYSWVTKLLDNKIKIGRYVALEQSISYTEIADNIAQGMKIMSGVTPEGIDQAIKLFGIEDPGFNATVHIPAAPRNIEFISTNSDAIAQIRPSD